MRTNGYIQTFISKGGGRNKTGEPIPITSKKGKQVPALIKTVTHHNKGRYEDNTFKVSSYEILIEKREFSASRIEVYMNGNSLGEYEVQSIEPIASYGRVKIVV